MCVGVVMALYDALPARVRLALAFSDFPIHPRVAAFWLRRGFSAERVADLIRRADRRLSRGFR